MIRETNKIKPSEEVPIKTPFSENVSSLEKKKEVNRIITELMSNLDEGAINQLLGGSGQDIDTLLEVMYQEVENCIYGQKNFVKETSLQYLEKLTENLEETLRIENLNYFISSTMPEFNMEWFHVEWSQFVMMHRKLCILAARNGGKCFSPDTKVMMFNGEIKQIKDIRVGELVMGPDSKPRRVLSKHTGVDDMYEIKPRRGESHVVNSRHTLTLLKKVSHYNGSGNTSGYHNEIIDIDLKDYLNLSKYQRENKYGLFKTITDLKKKEYPIEPYFLGLWLGDGNSHSSAVTTMDPEIVQYLKSYSERLGYPLYSSEKTKDNKARTYNISSGIQGKKTVLFKKLKKLKLIKNKHIPEVYFRGSKEDRLQLLAGLLDSDGYCAGNCIQVGQVSKRIALDIKRLAESLGFSVNFKKSQKRYEWMKRENKLYTSYCNTITGPVHLIPLKIQRKKFVLKDKQSHKNIDPIGDYNITVKHPIKVTPVGKGKYVGITIDGDRRFLLADSTVVHNSFFFSNCVPIWKMYRFKGKDDFLYRADESRMMSQRGFIVTNELDLGQDLLEIVKSSIEENPILNKKLFSNSRDNWSKQNIVCKNGARLSVKSYGGSFRGRHPGYIICDDILKDNVLYSESQRRKVNDYFHSVIMNAVLSGGQTIVVGTPFHQADLYGDLKTKKSWKVFEYPSIFPDGKLLTRRETFEELMDKKESQGNVIFSREKLVRPIVSDSSIFPWDVLKRALLGMEDLTLVKNRESIPRSIKFSKIVMGCDFAMSSSVGADSSVFSTWGVTESDEMYLLNMWHEKGKSYMEQIAVLKSLYSNFRHDVIYAESNQFQRIFVETLQQNDLPVFPHNTGTNKYDLKHGLPGLAIAFERNKIKLPRGDQYSIDITDALIAELSSVAWVDSGIQGVGSHDDRAMSLWLASLAAKHAATGFGVSFLD